MQSECACSALRCLKARGVCAKLKRMNTKQRLAIRLVLALAMGCIVAWMPLNMARGSWMTQFSTQQTTTQWRLKSVVSAVEFYKQERGNYPADLQTLSPDKFGKTDGWKRPWVYSVTGGKALVESLGRDGKRGGSHEDADLSNFAPRPKTAQLSTWGQWMHPAALGLRIVALLVGTSMATLIFVGLKQQTFERKSLLPLAISLFVSLAIAVFGAGFIAVAHVPSGH